MGDDELDSGDSDADLETLDELEIDEDGNPDLYVMPDKAMLTMKRPTTGWQLYYTPDPVFTKPTLFGPSQVSSVPVLIAEANLKRRELVTYPVNTRPGHRSLLEPQYDQLRSITLQGDYGPPQTHIARVLDYIRTLPAGFNKAPEAGFGLHSDIWYIIETVERIEEVTDLWIGERSADAPILDGSSYRMTVEEFHDARKAILRAHRKALAIAGNEKRVFLHNTLLHRIDPERFPEQEREYRKDAIRDAIGDSLVAKRRISKTDEEAIVKVVRATTPALVESRPEEVMELKREIEVVTLRVLIDRMQSMMGKNLAEPAWQSFFAENPFVLWLAFGFPVTVVGGSIAVGGTKLDGSGGKIADFAATAISTGNIALIEIKKPSTDILEKNAYRGNLYGPHRELTSAVSQVLDQRHRIQAEIYTLRYNSQRNDIETFAVQCLVIAGKAPTELDQKKSLELYRHSLHGISIVTYDELLIKLRHLLEFLQVPASSSEPGDAGTATDPSDPISGLV